MHYLVYKVVYIFCCVMTSKCWCGLQWIFPQHPYTQLPSSPLLAGYSVHSSKMRFLCLKEMLKRNTSKFITLEFGDNELILLDLVC